MLSVLNTEYQFKASLSSNIFDFFKVGRANRAKALPEKLKGPELGISGPALRGLAAGGDSPPRMLLCIGMIVAVKGLLVDNYLTDARKLVCLIPLFAGGRLGY
jgi:hypothetical protein